MSAIGFNGDIFEAMDVGRGIIPVNLGAITRATTTEPGRILRRFRAGSL